MNSTKVSVIVPVYNVENYLPRCLDSLVNQTLQDIEILVINDGSPDNSQVIIDDYARRYPDKIRPFIKENGGLSDARNYGITKASGEYLAFVDSDDYVDIDMYEKMYARAAETDADVVSCPVTYEHVATVRKRYYTGKEHLFGKSAVESPELFILTNSYAWNKIYRREFWLRGNYSFPKQHFEDSALIYGLMLDANKIEYVNISFYHYDQTRDGAITKTVNRRIFDIFKSCESIIASFTPRIEQNAAVRNVMVALCVRHILPRIKTLARSGDLALTKEFLDYTYAFLDENLPGWKSNFAAKATEEDGLKSKVTKWIFCHKTLAKVYYCLPIELRKPSHKAIAFLRKVKRKVTSSAAAVEKEKERKRAAIQSFGIPLIAFVQGILKEIGISSFADFGTMLGIIREGKLLAHDLDVDIGVILNEPFDAHRVRVVMERNGFILWRQYIMGDQLVEESYKLNDLKVDFNYYRMEETCAKTWLFYLKPGHKYEKINQRHIVEMTYSPIREMQTVTVGGTEIVIPQNAEQLLVEKYGESWRTPDTGWIYWQSPAATQIEGVGHFITHDYRNYTYVGEEWFSRCNENSLALIKRLQQKELMILEEVDRICRENHLTYYLGEGTLLGAMRHQGFIPWDDDVDILMPMEDYKKFLELAPRQIAPEYAVQHYHLMDRYWSIFTKVRLLDNSEFFQESLVGITEQNGPYIDIFPLSKVVKQPYKKFHSIKRQIVLCRRGISYNVGDTRPKVWKTKVYRLVCYFIPLKAFYKRLDTLYASLENPEGKYYANFTSHYAIKKQVFALEKYGEPRYVPFEHLMLPVPREAEHILATIYGQEWHKMPAYEYRKVKHSLVYRTADNEKVRMTIH